MLKRVITAIVAIAIFIPVCWFSDTDVWPVAMTILSVVAAWEMTKCIGASKHISLLSPAFFASVSVPFVCWRFPGNPWAGILGIYVPCLLWTFAADVFSRGKIDYEVSAASFMGIFYISTMVEVVQLYSIIKVQTLHLGN